jgi:serine phosphatase RsbU (regulator of sigma subunit)
MDIWRSSDRVQSAVSTPGLEVWVTCHPYQSAVGGDIHYLSLCGSGRVARFAVADVAGHGAAVTELSASLRQLMKKYINTLDQSHFAQALNREFAELSDTGTFATALLMTYFAPTDHLIVVNAGHPRPLWRQARHDRWQLLCSTAADTGQPLSETDVRYAMKPVSNLPLGVIDETQYEQFAVQLQPGDLLLIYTDGLSEAKDGQGRMVTEQGLLDVAKNLDLDDPSTISDQVFDALRRYRGGNEPDDDQTLLVLRHTAGDPDRPTLTQAVRVMAKMLGLAKV